MFACTILEVLGVVAGVAAAGYLAGRAAARALVWLMGYGDSE